MYIYTAVYIHLKIKCKSDANYCSLVMELLT